MLSLVLAMGVASSAQGVVQPRMAPLPVAAINARYDVKFMGFRVGEAETRLGDVSVLVDGQRVRTYYAAVRTTGVLKHFQRFERVFSTVVDADTFKPLRTRVKWITNRDVETWDYRYDKGRVAIEVQEGWRRIKRHLTSTGPADAASFLPWLQARQLGVGRKTKVRVLADSWFHQLEVKAAATEAVSVDFGTINAVRTEFNIPSSRVRSARLWLARDAYATPMRMLVDVKGLGDVSIELTHRWR